MLEASAKEAVGLLNCNYVNLESLVRKPSQLARRARRDIANYYSRLHKLSGCVSNSIAN